MPDISVQSEVKHAEVVLVALIRLGSADEISNLQPHYPGETFPFIELSNSITGGSLPNKVPKPRYRPGPIRQSICSHVSIN